MAVTAFKFPGTVASTGSGVAWSGPSNAESSDDARATSALAWPINLTSATLRCTNFGFTASDIPNDAAIDGIEVVIEKSRTGTGTLSDSKVQLLKASSPVGADRADTGTNWPASDTEAVYGGSADLWSAAWTQADIVAAGFGLDLAATLANDIFVSGTARVDAVKIRVYYTNPNFTGAGSPALSKARAAASGSYTPQAVGGGAAPTLRRMSTAASGALEFAAAGTANLPGVTIAASARAADNIGDAAAALPRLRAAAGGAYLPQPIAGVGAATAARTQPTALGLLSFFGALEAVLPRAAAGAGGVYTPRAIAGLSQIGLSRMPCAASGINYSWNPIAGEATTWVSASAGEDPWSSKAPAGTDWNGKAPASGPWVSAASDQTNWSAS